MLRLKERRIIVFSNDCYIYLHSNEYRKSRYHWYEKLVVIDWENLLEQYSMSGNFLDHEFPSIVREWNIIYGYDDLITSNRVIVCWCYYTFELLQSLYLISFHFLWLVMVVWLVLVVFVVVLGKEFHHNWLRKNNSMLPKGMTMEFVQAMMVMNKTWNRNRLLNSSVLGEINPLLIDLQKCDNEK